MGLFNVKLCWLSRGFKSQRRPCQMFARWAAPPVTLSPNSSLIGFTCVQWIRVFKSLSSLLRYRESMLMSNPDSRSCIAQSLHCIVTLYFWFETCTKCSIALKRAKHLWLQLWCKKLLLRRSFAEAMKSISVSSSVMSRNFKNVYSPKWRRYF